MIFFIILLSTVVIVRQDVSCLSIGSNENTDFNYSVRMEKERDYNSILDELPGRGARPSNLRSKRYFLESSPSNTETSTRIAYEKAINQTVSDYYAQRKAVMDRYYARQREIVDKFARKNSQPRKTVSDTRPSVSGNSTTLMRDASIENQAVMNDEANKRSYKNYGKKRVSEERQANQLENENSSVSWWQSWYPKKLTNPSDINHRSEFTNNPEKSGNSTRVSGYYKLGEFNGSKDEKVVYQHNLGVGLKGSSQLDATFEVVLDGAFTITVVEAFPYANTRANLSWVSGGPDCDYVKLKLRGYENEGFSYTVKVWGVPK